MDAESIVRYLSSNSSLLIVTRNFVVKKVTRLTLRKTLVWAGKQSVKQSKTSSVAKREGVNHPLIIYIADDIQLDYYE